MSKKEKPYNIESSLDIIKNEPEFIQKFIHRLLNKKNLLISKVAESEQENERLKGELSKVKEAWETCKSCKPV